MHFFESPEWAFCRGLSAFCGLFYCKRARLFLSIWYGGFFFPVETNRHPCDRMPKHATRQSTGTEPQGLTFRQRGFPRTEGNISSKFTSVHSSFRNYQYTFLHFLRQQDTRSPYMTVFWFCTECSVNEPIARTIWSALISTKTKGGFRKDIHCYVGDFSIFLSVANSLTTRETLHYSDTKIATYDIKVLFITITTACSQWNTK